MTPNEESAPQPGRRRTKWLVRFAIGLLVSAAILTALFKIAGFESISGAGLELRLGLLPVLLLIACILLLMRAVRFRFLLGREVRFGPLLCATLMHNLTNQVLPFKTGELGFPYFLSRYAGQRMVPALAFLAVSRVLDLLSVGIFFVGALFLNNAPWLDDLRPFGFGIVGLSLAGLVSIPWLGPKITPIFVRRTRNLKGRPAALHSALQSLDQALREYARFPLWRHITVVFVSLILWNFNFVLTWFGLKTLGVEFAYLDTIVGSTVGSLSSALPINGVGTFGSFEAGWTLGFVLLGMPKHTAVYTGLGVHLLYFAASILLGMIAFPIAEKLYRS